MKCINCKKQIPDDSSFCHFCGTSTSKLVDNLHSSASIDTVAINTNSKYCSKCGNVIDNNTKKCTGCGKQYFKPTAKNVLSIVLIIVLVVSIVANIILTIYNINLKKDNDLLYEYYFETFEQQRFFDKYIVFVEDDGTNLYHKYECSKFVGDYFWAYNVEAAIENGYIECPLCHN